MALQSAPYVAKSFVITLISSYLYPFSFTSFVISIAICSISEYGLFAKNTDKFGTSFSYFL